MKRWLAWFGCAALLLAGCAEYEQGGAAPMAGEMMTAAEPSVAQRPAGDAAAPEAESAGMPASPATTAPALKSRKIIYTGQIHVQCDALEPAIEQARGIVEQAGGYVSNLEQSGGATSREAVLTFRVPADRFDPIMADLGKLGTVRHRSFSTSDVTDQWVDLDARVRNLKREEQQYLELLARAGKVSELLEVERELARVRGEIEQIEGQLRRLNDQVALSTIELSLSLPSDKDASLETDSWLKQVVSEAAATVVHLARALLALAIWLVFLSPFVLVPVLLVAWVKRGRKS